MDTLIELTEADLDQIVGGGTAHASITQAALGVHNATVAARVSHSVTVTFASQLVSATATAV